MARRPGGLTVLGFALGVVLLVILVSYAVGYIAGKMVLGSAIAAASR